MRIVGVVLISVGLALFVFVLFNVIRDRSQMVSPIPDEKGVKVIFVTPSQ